MLEADKDNFLYWYHHATEGEVVSARVMYQATIDRLLMKYNLPDKNDKGIVFSESQEICTLAKIIDSIAKGVRNAFG